MTCAVCKCPPGDCCPCGCHEHASRQEAARRGTPKLDEVLAEQWRAKTLDDGTAILRWGQENIATMATFASEPSSEREGWGRWHSDELDPVRAGVDALGQRALAMMLKVEKAAPFEPCPVCGALLKGVDSHHQSCEWGAIVGAAKALG